ncbi:unnamed protein product [Cercospora beticola]|nr:unnamed protein product [Cercospora beticola]
MVEATFTLVLCMHIYHSPSSKSRPSTTSSHTDFGPSYRKTNTSKDHNKQTIDHISTLRKTSHQPRAPTSPTIISEDNDEQAIDRIATFRKTSHRRDSSTFQAITPQDNMSGTNNPTSFRDLSAELRNNIYKQALLLDDQVISVSGEQGKALPRNLPLAVNIIAANREIYKEATAMLYGGNTWYANTEEEAITFLSKIPRDNIAKIRRFELNYADWSGQGMRHFGYMHLKSLIQRSVRERVEKLLRCTGGELLPLSLDAIYVPDCRAPGSYCSLSELSVWNMFDYRQWKWELSRERTGIKECPK